MVAPPNVARQGGGANGGSGDGGVAPGEEEAEVVESEEAWLSSLGKQVRGRTTECPQWGHCSGEHGNVCHLDRTVQFLLPGGRCSAKPCREKNVRLAVIFL